MDEMDDFSLDEDSDNEPCLQRRPGDSFEDKRSREKFTKTDNALGYSPCSSQTLGYMDTNKTPNQSKGFLGTMLRNYFVPIIKQAFSDRHQSESSEDDESDGGMTVTSCEGVDDYPSPRKNAKGSLMLSRPVSCQEKPDELKSRRDIPKVIDGIVSLFNMASEKKQSITVGERKTAETSENYSKHRRQGRPVSQIDRDYSDDEAKQMLTRVMDCGNKILEGIGAYSDNERFMEFINNRFGMNPIKEEDQVLKIDLESAFQKPMTMGKLNRKVSKQISEMMTNEQHINDICSSVMCQSKYVNFCPIFQSGSIADGFSTPRWFTNNNVWEIETDIMYVLGEYPREAEAYFSSLPGQRAYCLLLCNPNHRGCIHPEIYRDVGELFTDDDYVNSLKFKMKALQFIRQYHFGPDKHTKGTSVADMLFHFASQFRHFNQQRLRNLKPSVSKTGHVASTVNCTLIGYNTFTASIDHVPCIKLDFWPEPFIGWLTRGGAWPTIEQRKQIMTMGCHVVPKTSDHIQEKGWRYSFSLPEHKLMQLFSQTQRRSYYLFKAIFYKYFKQIGQTENDNGSEKESVFHSYLFKTTMFWVCDKYPPEDDLWKEENLFLSLEILLGNFEQAMHERFLPHFFIPDYNLIQDVPVHLMDAAEMKAKTIKDNVFFYVPFNMEELINYVKDLGIRFGLQISLELALHYSFHSHDSLEAH